MGRLQALVVAAVVAAGTVVGVVPGVATAPAGAVVDPTPTVDPTNRASVWDAYQSSLVEAKGVPTGWTGSTGSCTEGTESAASRQATQAAVNFFRGLVGLPNVGLAESADHADAMRAALLQSANPGKAPNHYPDSSCTCWTQARDDASETHNLASIPAAAGVELYMTDPADSNDWAGHRSWILHPRGTAIATGSTSSYNALDMQTGGALPAGVDWIAWPNEGFVPKAVVRPYTWWSKSLFSLRNVAQSYDYSAASVTVKVGSTSLPVEIRDTNNQLTWYTTLPSDWDSNAVDVKLDISVSGLETSSGGTVPTHTYSSTAIVSGATATAPGAPTGVTASSPTTSSVSLSWTAPTSNGGSPITGYRVTPYIGASAQTVRTYTGTATTRTVANLNPGTTYTFRVEAVNAVGTGSASTASGPITTLTPATAPGAPTDVTAVAGDVSATVSWTAPTSTGGSPITGYRVTPYRGGVAQAAQGFSGTSTTRTVTGLTNGVAHTFRVQAVNAAGTSALSAASNAVTPSGPPYSPYSSWTHLIDQVHRQLLGRPATTAERNQWLNPLQTGTRTPGDLVASLRGSAHHRTIVDQVTRLYTAYYLRIPDRGGLEYWVGQRLGGRSLVSISAFFARSGEFVELYGTKTNREFVELIYENILGRPGEPAGVTYWTGEINAGRRGRGEVMVGFSESGEYKEDQAARVTVAVLYLMWLDRSPGAEELLAGVEALEGGQSVAAYAQSLLPKAAVLP